MNQNAWIGIDLGGTNVRAGVVTAAGQLTQWRDAPIEAHLGPEPGLQRIAALIEQVSSDAGIHPAAIGIGSTGPLDRKCGAIQNPYTLPGWEDVNIVRPLQDRFGVPVALENDADAAALGESWAGAGRGLNRLAMVTIGTGIGTAFILNGKIYRGMDDVHGEGGHMLLDPSGPLCYCGAHGCWESLAAGPAIGAYAAEQAAHSAPSLLLELAGGSPERVDAALVAQAARAGDGLALRMIERTATYIGMGLVNLMLLYYPDCIVFTGGVMRSYDLFENRIIEIVQQHSLMVPAREVKLRPSALGQQAGVIGAARAAMLLLEENHV